MSEVTIAVVTNDPSPGSPWHFDRLMAQSHHGAILSRACIKEFEGTEEGVYRAWVQYGVLIKGEHPGMTVSLSGKTADPKIECSGDAAILVKPDKYNPC
jgi:hypothetical protein